MNILLKGPALALALAGSMLSTGCMMDHDADRGMDRHTSDRDSGTMVAMDFGTVRYGYSDGYWDNGHQWHAWNNDGDMQTYRSRQGSVYHDWRHDRDGSDGWEQNQR